MTVRITLNDALHVNMEEVGLPDLLTVINRHSDKVLGEADIPPLSPSPVREVAAAVAPAKKAKKAKK